MCKTCNSHISKTIMHKKKQINMGTSVCKNVNLSYQNWPCMMFIFVYSRRAVKHM